MDKQPSRHNILAQIADSDAWYVANLLSGHSDILTAAEAALLQQGKGDARFEQRGYLVDSAAEEEQYQRAFREWQTGQCCEETQVFFVPWYACNFSCSYCYQTDYHNPTRPLSSQVLDAFFHFVEQELSDRPRYLTLFGGEPLLPGKAARDSVAAFLRRAAERGLETAIVSNGYHLTDYLPLLAGHAIREIQLTLDGPPAVHNQRRAHVQDGPSFERIADGLEQALDQGLAINLRVVLDRSNLDTLPELADLSRERGWSSHPRFKTQLGRSYRLHDCQLQADDDSLFSRAEFVQALYRVYRDNPQLADFHRPAFSVARHLREQGELPAPLFDACPACKTEWALDYTGQVYSCTATVGKQGEALGRFFPELRLDAGRIAHWQQRDVTTLAACQNCAQQLACGGGCAALASNQQGEIMNPDCRPVRESLALGMAHYFKQEIAQCRNTSTT